MSGYPHGLKTLTPDTTIVHAVQRLGKEFKVTPLDKASPYVKPFSVSYEFDGKPRRWDIIESHASVGVVLYHRELDAWLLVRQFRPAVYATACREAMAAGQPEPLLTAGFTFELCAGLIDKDKPNDVIAHEEIIEEVGYNVPVASIREVATALSSTGIQGSPHILYYAEVDESMRCNAGGGLASHGECIEVLALPVDSTEAFVLDNACPKSPGLMFGLMWSYANMMMGKIARKGQKASLETGQLTLNSVLPA